MSETLTTPSEFQLMLKKFNRIIEANPPVSQVKEQLETLVEYAKNSPALNARQREAITDRVRNYLNGTYGKNSKKEAYQSTQ